MNPVEVKKSKKKKTHGRTRETCLYFHAEQEAGKRRKPNAVGCEPKWCLLAALFFLLFFDSLIQFTAAHRPL
jgi:hypothetical protein